MILTGRPGKDDENAYSYFWKEREKSTTVVSGSAVAFDIEGAPIASVDIVNLSGLGSVPNGDRFVVNTAGRFKYKKYDTSAYVEKTGHRASYDVVVAFRKNGVDYIVDGGDYALSKGATYWKVTFTNAPQTTDADEIIISYPYTSTSKPLQNKMCVVDFNPKSNGGDYEVEQCIGGVQYKRKTALELVEVSLTTKKTGNDNSQAFYGDRNIDTTTWAGTTVRNVTGGNRTTNRAIVIEVQDPEDASNVFKAIFRNAGMTSVDYNGGIDNPFEETIVLKTEPYHYIEIEKDA